MFMDFETELYELPEALISKVLKSSGKQVEKLNHIYKNQLKPLEKSMKGLRETDLIQSLDKGDCTDIVSENEGDYTDAVSAVDGGKIISKSRGINTLLAVAVGVEGINCKAGKDWKKQCDSWIKIISHDENSDRLCQGVMSVMELNVILDSPHDIKIMDGTHFTPLLSIDKLLNISKEKQSKEYTQYLDEFFEESNLSDLSDIVGQFLTDKTIIAMPKYSSSRDIIESDKWKHYFPKNITIGDKFFFSWHLKPGEYTKPLSIGQSETGRKKWNNLEITCNIDKFKKWNEGLKEKLQLIKTQTSDPNSKEAQLYFTYYKPYEDKSAYRIECKKELVDNEQEFKKLLRSIKGQLCLPHIQEPYPQYLADKMAKSGSRVLRALQDAIQLSKELDENFKNHFIFESYRSAS